MNILTYLALFIFSFSFAYIFEVKEAYMIFYFIAMCPFIDLLTVLLARNNLEVDILVSDEYIEKNNISFNKIAFKNNGVIPIARVRYKILLDEKFIAVDKELKGEISVRGKGITYKDISVKPKHIGVATITIKDIKIEGIFGLFNRKYKEEIKGEVKILPSIVDVDNINLLIGEGTIGDLEIENEYIKTVGEPGYEYREYVPSDPLSKVNWKLSAKSNNLIIRKDESSARAKKIVLIDPKIEEELEDKLMIIDLLLEGALGICKEIMSLEYDASLVYKIDDRWNEKVLEDDESIGDIRRTLAEIYFTDYDRRLNGANVFNASEYDDVIILTACRDSRLLEFIDEIGYDCNKIYLISNNKRKIVQEQFCLNEDYSLERI